jgi:phosphoribosylformylglycinamidine synthase
MVGIIDEPSKVMGLAFQNEGDAIVLIGPRTNDLGSSQYLAKVKGVEFSPCPEFNLDTEHQLHLFLEELSCGGYAQSVHDISEGGLFVCCAESAISGQLGFDICTDKDLRMDASLFGEGQSRVVVSVSQDKVGELIKIADKMGLPVLHMGTVTSGAVIVNGETWGDIQEFANPYHTAIEGYLS